MTTASTTKVLDSKQGTPGGAAPRRLLIVTLASALVAVSVLAAWLYVDSRSGPPSLGWDEAPARTVTAVDGSLDAFNRGDIEDAFGVYFTEDAVFQEVGSGGSGGIEGRAAITKAMRSIYDLGARYERVSDVLQRGNVAIFAVDCGPCPGNDSEIDVVHFDEDGKIVYYWTIIGT
jgi:hypothetical protein